VVWRLQFKQTGATPFNKCAKKNLRYQHEAGAPVPDLARRHGVAENTIYRWKSKFGGMEVSEAKRLRELERENAELKKMVAEQALDIRMLKDINSRKW